MRANPLVFSELAVIDGLPRSASAIVADETIVHVLSRERLRAHLLASPQLAYNFMQALAVRVRYSTLQVGNLTLHDVPSRLARSCWNWRRVTGASPSPA